MIQNNPPSILMLASFLRGPLLTPTDFWPRLRREALLGVEYAAAPETARRTVAAESFIVSFEFADQTCAAA